MAINFTLEYSEYETLKMYLDAINNLHRGALENSLQYGNIETNGNFLTEDELKEKEEEINLFFADIRKIKEKHFNE